MPSRIRLSSSFFRTIPFYFTIAPKTLYLSWLQIEKE